MTALPTGVTSPGGSSRLLRHINDRAALACLFLRDTLTRPELVALTGFSKPTASEVIKRLRAAGLVTVAGQTSGGPGPRADVYTISADAAFGVAVSVCEPNQLAVNVTDLRGQVRTVTRSTVAYGADSADILVHSVKQACAAAGAPLNRLSQVYVAVPGSYDARLDVVRNIDVPGFDRPGLSQEVAQQLGTAVRIDNDVNLAALAERHHGAGGDDGFALLWLGERGIGLGIDLGSELLHGFRGAAGEVGYLPIGPAGSGGGKQNSLQALVGGPTILELATQRGHKASSAQKAVSMAADADDREFFALIADRIVAGLAAVVSILDPAMVVLAGEVGRAGGSLLSEAATTALARLGFEFPVTVTQVKDDPVLRGGLDAALAAIRQSLLAGPA